ncbi:HAD family hydrolase [Bacillus timonensis]|nr:HAD family hydrolase [Bacillus timonensis]
MSSFEGVIFDLDDTIIDTAEIKHLRKSPWSECYKYIPTKTFSYFGKELSSVIQERNLKVGIVTNSPRSYATRVLSQHNFYYDDLICFHDCEKRKPFPDPLLKCSLNLGVSPKNIISIGDSINDIIATKRAGMTSVGVTWGESARLELIETVPDYIVNNAMELISLLREL